MLEQTPAATASGPRLIIGLRTLLAEVTDPESYRFVARQAKYPVIASVISQTALGFGLVAVLSRGLGAEAFGRYGIVLTILTLFQVLVGFQAETGVAKYLPQARQVGLEEVRAYYSAGLTLRLLASLTALLVTILLAEPLCRAYGIPELVPALRIASISACVLAPLTFFFLACMQGGERPRRWAAGTLISACLVFPLGLIGAQGFHHWGFPGLFIALVSAWAVTLVICAALARGALGFLLPRRTAGHLREMFFFALPMAVVPLAGFGAQVVSKSMLTHSWGPVPVGQFEIALSLQQHMGIFYSASMTVLLPAWSRLYSQRQGAELLQSIAYARGALVGLALAYGALLVLGGPWVIPALFGTEQAGAIPAARIMGLVLPVMIIGWVASTTAVVSGRTSIVGIANVIWFGLAAPLGLLLIPKLGAAGAALGWLAAYAVFSWYYISRSRQFFREVSGWAGHLPVDAKPADPVGPAGEIA